MYILFSGTMAGLAQLVECLSAEQWVAGSIPRAGPTPRALRQLRIEGTPFALQAARPSHGCDDHSCKLAVPSPAKKNSVKIVFPIRTFVQNTLTLK